MPESQEIYEFSVFRLNVAEGQLCAGGRTLALPPKAFETLAVLVQNSGHVLSKEELMQHVWPDSFVEENNLAQHISLLRKALAEIQSLTFIETVAKRGYRFCQPVRVCAAETETVIRERTRATVVIEEEFDDETAQSGSQSSQSNAVRPAALPAPRTHYVLSGDANIAYQVVGSGEIDLVFVMGWVSHLEYFWEEPRFAAFLSRLASFSRLILFDKRGTGLSDRVPLNQLPTLEQRMEDVHAVMDAVGSERAVLMGVSEGGPMCALFAATYPERTAGLIMIGTYAKRVWAEDYPWAPTMAQREKFLAYMQREWGGPVGIEDRAPSLAQDPAFRRWWATYLRLGASPGAAVALTKMNAEIDVRQVLPSVRVPALVLHRTGDMCLRVEEGRYVAALLSLCRYVELPGIDHLPFVGEQGEMLKEIESFLTSLRYAVEVNHVLATVLTVMLSPTGAARMARRESAESYVRRQIELFKGKTLDYGAHGVQATFDGPARAIRCAGTLNQLAQRFGVELQIGIHTGECEITQATVRGVAVAISAEVANLAATGKIIVSRTVKDLVAGSGLIFQDYGRQKLPAAMGEWRLFAVAP